MAEIRAALAAGLTVITHTDAVSVPGWSGAGYILLDPLTGDGAYKISGGANGGIIFWVTILAILIMMIILLVSPGPLFLVYFGEFFLTLTAYGFTETVRNLSHSTHTEEQMERELNEAAALAALGSIAGMIGQNSLQVMMTLWFFIFGETWAPFYTKNKVLP